MLLLKKETKLCYLWKTVEKVLSQAISEKPKALIKKLSKGYFYK